MLRTGSPARCARAAAAVELLQACALLHDDILDRSDTRRGEPSMHRAVSKAHADHGWTGDAEHYGGSVALLLGDLALVWADDLATAALDDVGRPAAAVSAWRTIRSEVLAGQLLDLLVTADPAADPVAAEADAMVVNRLKTAAYTVGRPLELGAALAGGSDAVVAALRGYGAAVGLAFQLRDDHLGVFGDPTLTGKPAGGDLVEGKRTVLLARSRAALAGRPAELAEIDDGIGRSSLPAGRVARLTELIAGSGAADEVDALIAELTATGIDALAVVDGSGAPVLHPAVVAALTQIAVGASGRSR